ncbi:MAG: diaminopimelate decarboxylase [Betaproteobacteria bacterium]|nr:MAG: diaminopimelate decarboxylase [Betaproteobacteria bacterium]
MSFFAERDNELNVEDVPLSRIAEQFGTPCFVYSRAALTSTYRAYEEQFGAHPHLICYAAKANSNLAILDILARLGSGFDIVSGGELRRVLAAGGNPRKVVFSGVGKSEAELREAVAADILCFNVESESEMQRLARIAHDAGRVAPVSVRVNPDVDARTHPYISTGLRRNKFGVGVEDALRLYQYAQATPSLRVTGIDCHIGSQLTDLAPMEDAAGKVVALVDQLADTGIDIEHIDFGGGLGIRYTDETPPPQTELVKMLLDCVGPRQLAIMIEPGRSLIGNAGVLLTRVEYLKHGQEKNFAVIDAAMNDLMRPALYDAHHDIRPVRNTDKPGSIYDVVGPVCETGDFLGKDRTLAIDEGDLLAVMSAGAYAMSMSSNYNTRPRAAEIMVDGSSVHLVGERERVEDLYARESRLP